MPLALLQPPDATDDGPDRVESEPRLRLSRDLQGVEIFHVHTVAEHDPAPAHPMGFGLRAKRVRIRHDRVREPADDPPGQLCLPVRPGETPLPGHHHRDAGQAARENGQEGWTPLVGLQHVDTRIAETTRLSADRADSLHAEETSAHIQRADADSSRPQRVLDRATPAQRHHLDDLELLRIQQSQDLLQVSLRASHVEQGGIEGDANHAHPSARTGAPTRAGPTGTATRVASRATFS
jgi:hypothetical protein